MEIQYKNYKIEIFIDENFTPNSVDNLTQYDKVFFEGNLHEDRFYQTLKLAIIIKKNDVEASNVIICEVHGINFLTKNSFIIEDDMIWICVFNKVYCLSIPTLALIWQKQVDYVSNISIHKLENDFIIHGEMEILRITKEGVIIWRFGGRDIWVNIDGKVEFIIQEKSILLNDFESNEYEIDFDGNLIKENQNVSSIKNYKKWWQIFKYY